MTPSYAKPQLSRIATLLGYVLACALFWGLRVAYWHHIEEAPFSDMADFLNVANGILTRGSFAHSAFWQTYKLPVVPLLMAGVFAVAGHVDVDAWRWAQTIFLFAAAAWLAREIFKQTGSHFLAIGLLLIVGITRSSIFWSYKPASESVAEAFVYLLAAGMLWFYRTRTAIPAAVVGVTCVAAMLARANFFPMIAVFGLAMLVHPPIWKVQHKARALIPAAVFALAVVGAWSPWIVRNYLIYGEFVPISCQGPYTFLWELGSVTATLPDGTRTARDVNELQREAATRFPTDYAASKHAGLFVRAWLAEHRADYLRVVHQRMTRQVRDRSEYLTTVPRDNLFGFRPEPLLDKSATLVNIGLIGLVALGWTRRDTLVLPAIPLTLWPFGALFLGYPRMFDPYLPLTLFGLVALCWQVLQATRVFFRKRSDV